MHHIVVYDLQAADFLTGEFHIAHFIVQHVVDLHDNIENLRHNRAHQVARPFFKRLGHDGVIGIAEHLVADAERLLEIQIMILCELTDKLRNGDDRMGIVQLYGKVLPKFEEIVAVIFLIVL